MSTFITRNRLILVGKGKVYPRKSHEGPEGEWCITLHSSSFFNLGARWHWVINAVLPAGKIRYPLFRRLGGPHRSGRVRKISPSSEFDFRTVQPVTSRCYRKISCLVDGFLHFLWARFGTESYWTTTASTSFPFRCFDVCCHRIIRCYRPIVCHRKRS